MVSCTPRWLISAMLRAFAELMEIKCRCEIKAITQELVHSYISISPARPHILISARFLSLGADFSVTSLPLLPQSTLSSKASQPSSLLLAMLLPPLNPLPCSFWLIKSHCSPSAFEFDCEGEGETGRETRVGVEMMENSSSVEVEEAMEAVRDMAGAEAGGEGERRAFSFSEPEG